jgi:polar amino acid transport system substrate-binding protein
MKKFTFVLASFMLFMMLYAPTASGDQLADIKAARKLVVGSDTTYPPFEYIDSNDAAVGFDVDFAEQVGVELGVDVEIKTVVWDTIIPSLQTGEFDVIISAMTITTERAAEIDFSKPYYNSTQGILVATGNPKEIVDENDLNVAGLKIGVQTGTTSDIWVTENAPLATITRLAGFDELYPKMDLGELDVILGDTPVIGYASTQGDVAGEVVAEFGAPEQFGVGVKKGETALLNAINDAIDAMLADGRYGDIKQTWFGIGGASDEAPVDNLFVFLGIFVATVTVIRKRRN